MTDQWQIYKADGAIIGPLSPLEVRDALRSGSIDAFDLVARVGSNVRRPLVEVDEIFISAEEAAKSKVDSIYDPPEAEILGRAYGEVTKVAAAGGRQAPRPQAMKAEGVRPQNLAKRRHAKKYFIVDKRRNHYGPLSAPEIQSLFYKGLIPHTSSVTKQRNGPKTSIQQFITAYAGAQAKKYRDDQTKFDFSQIKGLPNSKSLDFWAKTRVHQTVLPKNSLTWTNLLLIFSSAVVIYLSINLFWAKKPQTVQQPISVQPQTNTAIFTEKAPKKLDSAVEPGRGSTSSKATKRASEKTNVRQSARSKAPNNRRLPQPQIKRNAQPAKPSVVPSRIQPQRSTPAVTKPVLKASRPVATTQPTPRTSGNPYLARNGQVITVSQVKYNPTQLRQCGLKCTLKANDVNGLEIQLVFFKEQFAGELSRRKGQATITGRIDVENGVNTIFLQSVN